MGKRKKSKYTKQFIETWSCQGCEFQWSYRTMKCPLCYSMETLQIV